MSVELTCDHCQGKVCSHNGVYWLKMCPQAKAWTEETVARWERERLHPCQPTKIIYHGQHAQAEAERRLREELA